MDFSQLVIDRRSIRAFKATPVSRETLFQILDQARHSPSTANIQPWEVHVVTGAVLEAIKQELSQAALEKAPPQAEVDFSWDLPETHQNRMKKALAGSTAAGWGTEKEARAARMRAQYDFYGAPVVFFICLNASLGSLCLFDAGLYAQTLCLSLADAGMGSCIQYVPVTYPALIKKNLKLGQEKKLVIAVAAGYPDPEHRANSFRSERDSVENTVAWYGFAP